MRKLAFYLFLATMPWLVAQPGSAQDIPWIYDTVFDSPKWWPYYAGEGTQCLSWVGEGGSPSSGPGCGPRNFGLDGDSKAEGGNDVYGTRCSEPGGCGMEYYPQLLFGRYHPAPYVPATEGEILHMDLSFRVQHRGSAVGGLELHADPAFNFYVLIKQNNNYYVSNASVVATENDNDDVLPNEGPIVEWVTPRLYPTDFGKLTSADPSQADFFDRPNFTSSGAALYFGYAVETGDWAGEIGWDQGGMWRWWAIDAFTVYANAQDFDGDNIADAFDNCIEVPNADQHDTTGDGFGNMCDADYNDDGCVNAQDLIDLSIAWQCVEGVRGRCGGAGAYCDIGGDDCEAPATCEECYDENIDKQPDGLINAQELILLSQQWQKPPGPSGIAEAQGCQ